MTRPSLHRHRLAGPALGAAIVLILGVGTMSAGAVAGTSSSAALAMAELTEARLGLPVPAGRSVVRVHDPRSALMVDEVTDLDALGRPVAISRFDAAGRLISSVRLRFVPPAGSSVIAADATLAATAIAARAGVPTPGSATATPRASGGWLVRWVRRVGAVPVPGDGVSVQLDARGSFHGIVRTEHELAPAPTIPIEAGRARLLAEARLDQWFPAGLRGDAVITSVALAWIAANDAFGDALPGGPAGLLRLAWVVRVTTSGSLAETVAGLELAFDAGDGAPLGGDLVE